jgi:hypothetical protein
VVKFACAARLYPHGRMANSGSPRITCGCPRRFAEVCRTSKIAQQLTRYARVPRTWENCGG